MNIRRMLEAAQGALPSARRGVVVLAYHLVGAATNSPVDISVDEFRRQMELLHSECDVLSLDEALARGVETTVARRPKVVLTFDDAYLNFRRVAWPVLGGLGLTATLYVPLGFVNGTSGCPIRGTTLPACSWEDLKVLASEGVSVGSHTVSHVNLTRMRRDDVERELRKSRDELEQRLSLAVKSFCYPQGKWNDRVLRQVALVYDNAVVGGGRRLVNEDQRHRIPRFPVRRDISSFESILSARVWLGEAAADIVRQRVA